MWVCLCLCVGVCGVGERRKYVQVVPYPGLAAQPHLEHREDEISQLSNTEEEAGQEEGDRGGAGDSCASGTVDQEEVGLGEEVGDSGGEEVEEEEAGGIKQVGV